MEKETNQYLYMMFKDHLNIFLPDLAGVVDVGWHTTHFSLAVLFLFCEIEVIGVYGCNYWGF